MTTDNTGTDPKRDTGDLQNQMRELQSRIDSLEQEKSALEQINADMNKAIAQAHELAMEAQISNMAKSDFVARMSQKLKPPMHRIIGFIDLLERTDLSAAQSDYVHQIRMGSQNLIAMMHTIVDFTKMSAGHVNIGRVDFDIELLAYDICEITRYKIERKPVTLTCSIDDDLPALVKGDPQRFRQILLNLMDNAAKFTDRGSIELQLRLLEEDESRYRISCRVCDTGIGIKKKKIPIIFEAFKSSDQTKPDKHGGAGLGLSLCRQIALLLDGDISVESKLKQGSTFDFTVWVEKADEKKQKKIERVPLNGRRVLIADSGDNDDVLVYLLESLGITVLSAPSGAGLIPALEQQSGDTVDVCIIDLDMKDSNPFDIAKQIIDLPCPKPSLLAVSSSTNVVKSCRSTGIHGFLPKPIHRIKLIKMLEALLWQRRENLHSDLITQYTIREDAKHATAVTAVEADSLRREQAQRMLTAAGYLTTVTATAGEAAERITSTSEPPDIILISGESLSEPPGRVAQELRTAAGSSVPLICFLQGQRPGDAEALCAEGLFNDAVTAPLNRPSVYRMVQKWLLDVA